MKKFSYKYAIMARNSSGVTEYFVIGNGQPAVMMEFAHSLAHIYNSRKEAYTHMEMIKPKYKGLTDWKLEYRKYFV